MTAASRIPKTRRHGEARAIKMLRDLEQLNWNRSAPVKSGKHFDAVMRASMSWPREARLGFSYVVGDWLSTTVLGVVYSLEDYEPALSRGQRGTDNPRK
jgi:hypothetical protein